MFTVKELKEILANIPDDTPIILQGDDEGNSYRCMSGISFIPEGENTNYYNEEEQSCLRQSDFEYYYDTQDIEPKEKGLVLCAVAY